MKIDTNALYRAVSLATVFWTTVSMSAYTPHETGSRTTASGAKAKEGYTCAANFVPIGSIIIYDGHKYCVQDRMNPKYNRHVDIFMESHKKALQFGRKEAKVQVITQGDVKLKQPKNDKTTKPAVKKEEKKTTEPLKENNTNTAVVRQHTSVPKAPAVLKPNKNP